MFDKDLFYSLYEKYQVELSDKFESPMIKNNNSIEPLTKLYVSSIFSVEQNTFTYNSSFDYRGKLDAPLTFEFTDYIEAC